MLISLVEYAKMHGKDPSNARRLAEGGRFATARKIGRNWAIEDTEPWPDNRLKSGKYVGWRKKHGNHCDCGKVVEVRKYSLESGNTTSCGCSRHEDLTGQRFGKLTAISYEGYKGRAAMWRCRCDCGKEIVTRASSLKSGNTTSCGCAVDASHALQDRVDGTRLGGISPKRKARGSSGVKGVSWNRRRGKWEAYIQLQGHQYHLGLYDTLDAAAEARRKAEAEYFTPILEKYKKSPGS